MTRRYFGTDGIRGRANKPPMTPEVAMRLGVAAGRAFVRGDHRHRVVIGKDTRLSGYMIEGALQAGFVAAGMDVILLGPVPTPAVGMLTRSLRADLGVMISASHNPFHDNGVKLFGPDGFKLSDAREAEIEAMIDGPLESGLVDASALGRARRLDDGRARYIEFAKSTFPKHLTLEDLKIVVDCANGAAHSTAPTVFWELGAEIVAIGVSPDGTNINRDCGSTTPEATCRKVRESGADLGVCLDGDADRVILVDEYGRVIDGDQIMALVTTSWARSGDLKGGGLVATVMSNLGLERRLAADGLKLERTRVGDRYVVERMREKGFNIGGEQSGHIVLSDFTTTGDGIIAALQTLAAVVQAGRPASEVCRLFEPAPQVLKNARVVNAGALLSSASVKRAIAEAEDRLGSGRLVIRPSGTEPVVRVMAEGDDPAQVEEVVDHLVDLLTRESERTAA